VELLVEARDLCRQLAAFNRAAILPVLATVANNLGLRLSAVGRRAEALAATQEAVELRRELAAADRAAFLPDLAASLNNLGADLSAVGRRAEALAATQEAVELRRELASANRAAFLPDLATSLNNMGERLSEVGRLAQALEATQEAVELCRELAAANRAFLPDLAMSLNNLGARLSDVGRRGDALEVTQQAVTLCRELAAVFRAAFLPLLTRSLANLSNRHSEFGLRAEALECWRECAALLMDVAPADPHEWTELARGPTRNLDTPQDLQRWHLPLLRTLTEYRELAYDTEHARLFLDLQAEAAARVWNLLGTLGSAQGELLDEAVARLVATLHGPDLARTLREQGADFGSTAELARLKREVIEADQVFDALMKELGAGAGVGGVRAAGSEATQQHQAELQEKVRRQSELVRHARAAFRAERERLIETDRRFLSAFEPPGIEAIRAAARHGGASAVLCLLQIPAEDGDRPLSVGALIDAAGGPTRLLDFDGLYDTASRLAAYPARENGVADLTTLEERLRKTFWQVLQRAREDIATGADGRRGSALERLHVCGHGLLQHVPLGLRGEHDCPGLEVLAWPGLAYLRLAAARGQAASSNARSAEKPWQVGYECAWNSSQPLPMVAVEAALVRRLLRQHGQPVREIVNTAEVQGSSAALVLCCHGASSALGPLDDALVLGEDTLRVRTIVAQQLGPAFVLLAVNHAGETREDSAGNALGMAAGFLLAGSRVVAASSKAVPDVLMPWLSTLTVWHVVNGADAQQAAQRAREQFGKGEFPQAYRSWLQQALPQALATLQPGGSEHAAMSRSVNGAHALREVLQAWPWGGDALGLLSEDAATRQRAGEDLAQQVLQPREDAAAELPQALREMAAFFVIYGVG
jgi:tetratricopeptide (TPR) repeat protein